MATIVNTFPDRRAALLGKGVGALVGGVLDARRKKRQEEEEKKKLKLALDLLSRASGGEKAQFPAAQAGAQKPQKTQAKQGIQSQQLPPQQGRVPTGGDVGIAFKEAGLENEFAIKLAQGVNEARMKQERLAFQQEELRRVLEKAGASEELLFSAIAASKLPADIKLRLVPQVENLAKKAPEDKEFIDIKAYTLKDGQEVPVRIPKELQGASVAVLDEYLQKDLGLEVTSQPQLQTTGVERQHERDIRTLGGTADIEHIVAAQNQGLVTVRTTAEGQFITNLAARETSFTPNASMDVVSRRKIQFRLAAVEETLAQLGVDPLTGKRIPGGGLDLEGGLGLEGFLTAEVGGFISNIWLGDMALDFMGIEPSEIARAQAARSGFFNVIVPFAEAISAGEGGRDIITSKFGIGIAQEILLIRELSTTKEGAELAINKIVKLFQGLHSIMEVQLRTGTMFRPKMISIDWVQSDDNKLKGTESK